MLTLVLAPGLNQVEKQPFADVLPWLYKKGVLKNFTKFKRKHLYQSLSFNKVAGLRPAVLLKTRLKQRRCPAKFLRMLFL